MQFGRFHGIALLALGAILLFIQVVVSFEDRSASSAKAAASQQRAETDGQPADGRLRELSFLPGIIGIALAGAGWFVLVRAQRKGIPGSAMEDRSSGPGAHVSTPTIWKER
ncbi:MAG TPA: hypothetical protein VFN20_04735 [Candidatus Acidoferrum sp.]|nr:hypothetical protein [Candidatus Acidoferrum sp.]